MSRLFIAEKPNVAVNIAKALNCTTRKDGYFEGNGNIVTFAIGHLLELKDSVDYDPSMEVWTLDKFPFIPDKFEYKVRTIGSGKEKKVDKGAEKQLKIIKSLVNRNDVTEVVNACDDDREGSLIFKVIADYLKINKPILRMKLNEWTPSEINNAIKKLLPNSQDIHRQIAGECRQHADFTIGINFTSTATCQYARGRGNPLSIGRVVLPTLRLIYDRDMEIKNFKPQKFYELKAIFDTAKGRYEGLLINRKKETRFDEFKDIILIQNEISQKDAFVKEKSIKRSKQNAPSLFNLNDLEGYITSKYSGWTSDKVDKIVQILYEGKGNGGFISYPRTKSRHLESTNEFINKTKKVLETLKKGLPYENEINFHTDKRVFDSSKVDGHGAIIPTYIVPTGLSKDEQLVYDAIVKRFLAQFMPPAEYENTEIYTQINGTELERLFITKGKILISEGWQKLYGKESQDEVLPPIEQGDKATIHSLEPLTKETQPPNHYTEKTLFKAMETCGKKVKDSDSDDMDEEILSAILSGYEVGTPATRSSTLKKMRSIGYVELKGKSLIITELGIRLIETFPVYELMDLDFTGKLEKTLSDIEKGKHTKEEFMEVIKNLTIKGVEKIKNKKGLVVDYNVQREKQIEAKTIGTCPECGKPILEGTKGYGCSGWKEGCKFVIWKDNPFLAKFGIKAVDKKTVKALLENPEGIEIRVNSTTILARLVKEDNKFNIKFEINEKKFSLGKCPECGKNVVVNSKAFTCEDRNCNFVIFKNDKFLAKYNKKPTEAMIKSLLNSGAVLVKGMQSPNEGKGKFYCTLKLEKNGQYWNFKMVFDDKEKATSASNNSEKVVGKCLECGRDVIESKNVYKCSNNNCNFILFKKDKFLATFKKQLTNSIVSELLKSQKARVEGFYSQKKSKNFDADLVLFKNGQYWNFKLQF